MIREAKQWERQQTVKKKNICTLPEMEMYDAPALWHNIERSFKDKYMDTLTVTDVVKGPPVVLKEGVTFYLVHSGAAQTNLPAHSDRNKQSDGEQVCLSVTQCNAVQHTPFLLSTHHHKHVIQNTWNLAA